MKEMNGKKATLKEISAYFDKQIVVIVYIVVLFIISRLSMYLIFHNQTDSWNPGEFISKFSTWDSGWYCSYAKGLMDGNAYSVMNGQSGQGVWAFFPLYPFIVGLLWKIIGCKIEIHILGAIVSSIFFCIAEFFAYKYIMLMRNSKVAAYAFIAFMSLGLYSFYFSIIYTESCFLMLLILSFYCLKKKKYILMGIFGALLSATRSAGVFFVFVILVDCIMDYQKRSDEKKSFGKFIVKQISNSRLIFGTFLVPLGLFVYMHILSKVLGDGFAFVHVQRGWGKNNAGMLENLKAAVVDVFPPSYLGIATIVILVLILYLIRNKHYDEALYSFIVLLMGSSSSLYSIPRYMIGSFCIVLSFSDEYAKLSKFSKIIIGVLVFGFELVLIRYWIEHNGLLI